MAKKNETNGTAVLTPTDSRTLAQFRALATANNAKTVEGGRDKIDVQMDNFVVARLVGIREGGKDAESFRIYDLDGPKSERLFLLGAADLDQKITGPLVNHVLGIACVGEKNVGKPSPMRVFEIVDFGAEWPKGDDELPF